MKKIILPMLALFAGVAFTACQDQLEIEQKGVVSTETFFKTDADAEKALASAYENFQINTVGRTTIGPSIYTPFRVLANHPGDDVTVTMSSADLSTSSVISTPPRPSMLSIEAFTSLFITTTSC